MEVKNAIAEKKEAYKVTMQEQMQNKVLKSEAVKMRLKKEIGNLGKISNNIFKFVKSMQIDGKDVEGGQCIRNARGRLGYL